MPDRIPRSQIQLATLQAAKAQLDRLGSDDIQQIPKAERDGFVQAVQSQVVDLPASEVRDVLQAEWMKGNESLLGRLQAAKLQSIFDSAASDVSIQRPLERGDGTYSPVGLRLQAENSPDKAPFWHKTTAEGPYSGD